MARQGRCRHGPVSQGHCLVRRAPKENQTTLAISAAPRLKLKRSTAPRRDVGHERPDNKRRRVEHCSRRKWRVYLHTSTTTCCRGLILLPRDFRRRLRLRSGQRGLFSCNSPEGTHGCGFSPRAGHRSGHVRKLRRHQRPEDQYVLDFPVIAVATDSSVKSRKTADGRACEALKGGCGSPRRKIDPRVALPSRRRARAAAKAAKRPRALPAQSRGRQGGGGFPSGGRRVTRRHCQPEATVEALTTRWRSGKPILPAPPQPKRTPKSQGMIGTVVLSDPPVIPRRLAIPPHRRRNRAPGARQTPVQPIRKGRSQTETTRGGLVVWPDGRRIYRARGN